MHTLTLKWREVSHDHPRLNTLIDGENLAALAARCERRHVPKAEKRLVTAWSGFFEFSGHWLEYWLEDSGPCGAWDYFDGYAVILVCGDCGVDGCDALTADIRMTGKTVVWNQFRNPRQPHWDYAGLGPFTFSRPLYEAEIERALTEMQARFGS